VKSQQNDKFELAVIASLLLHALLIGLLLLGSFFTNTKLPESAGGNGGEGEEFEAVMVDTGQVAAEYGRLKSERQGNQQRKLSLKSNLKKKLWKKNRMSQHQKKLLRKKSKNNSVFR